jgi:cholesterol oxidase
MSETFSRWSQPAQQWLREFHDAPDCDVLIVGTGYGGSFAAQTLSQQGRRVWVVERGREYPAGSFPEDIGHLPGHVRLQQGADSDGVGNADALLDFRRHTDVSVLVANGLGGGSLINAGVAVLPDPDLPLDPRWPRHYREHAAHRQALSDAMAEAQNSLQAQPFAGAADLKKFQALQALGSSMGNTAVAVPITVAQADQTSPAGVAQAGCTRCGNCFTGCNVGAKNTTVTHVLPHAVRQGARLITGLTVLDVRPLDASAAGLAGNGQPLRWAVRMVLSDDLSQADRPAIVVRARTVVLAAGALGSTEILLRSRAAGLPVSPRLGQRFSTNGDALAMGWGMGKRVNGMARANEADAAPADRVGPTITGMLSPTVMVNGQPRRVLVEEGAVPSALTQAVVALGATLSLPHRYTRDGLGYFDQRPHADPLSTPADIDRHALLLLLMGPDEADGSVAWRPAGTRDADHPTAAPSRRDALDIRWSGVGTGPRSNYYHALHLWLRQAQDRGGFQGGDYLPSPLWKPLPDDFAGIAQGVGGGQGLTVHPLGGCAMGDGPDTGVVDWKGTVFHEHGGLHDGLHVLDGAMLPTAVGVNPFITISGLSLVAARALARDWEQESAAAVAHPWPPTCPAPLPTPSVRSAPASVQAVQPVRLQFNEHLQGPWLGERPTGMPATPPAWSAEERQREWVVSVEVSLDTEAWLANPSQRLNGSRLRVFHNPEPHGLSVPADRLATATPWLEGSGWVALLARDAPPHALARTWRAAKAIWAFVQRRSLAEAATDDDRPWYDKLAAFWRVARNHAQYRTLDYEFRLSAPDGSLPPVRARGSKRLAYAPGEKNPWSALIEIELALSDESSGTELGSLSLTVDLIDMVRRHRLQVLKAPDTPSAIIGLAGFAALWLRSVFQTHFWSLRGLDYDKLAPPQPAVHGPLRPQGPSGPVCPPQRFELVVPRERDPGSLLPPLTLELTRYTPPTGSQPDKHLLMIHGLAHGATVFTTDTTQGRNMATAFLAEGYTVWLLDHRLSNRLGFATQPHCMDDVAQLDIPAAVRHVHSEAGQPIRVVAHCVGGGAFAMATLRGWLTDDQGHSRVRSAIIHAVHPWVVPSASNQLSGDLASLYRDWLPADLSIDPVPPRTPTAVDQVLDRLAASLPWPASEQAAHLAHVHHAAAGTATCNRMTLFYGREWVHANLAEATHRELAGLVGPASVEVFRQFYYIITRQRLTDREGANVYMTQAGFDAHWTFPTLFATGTQNKVFDPRCAVRSWLELSRLQAGVRSRVPDDRHQRLVRLFMPDGYGHMDFLFGQDAHREVYPSLVRFLADPLAFESSFGVSHGDPDVAHRHIPSQWQDHSQAQVQAPLTGPMVQVESSPVPELVVWVELPNDPWRDAAAPALVAVEPGGRTTPLTGVRAIRLQAVHPVGETSTPVPGHRASRVTLLHGPGAYWVLRVADSPAQPLANLPPLKLVWGREPVQPGGRWGGEADLPLADQPWWRIWVRTVRPGAPTAPAAVSWLASSCRWPGLPFERHAIDALADQMSAHVRHPVRPAQALVLLGDQIYADATANLFEVQEGDERLAQFYRDAWGSPRTRELLARLPTHLVVDDHEYRDNWRGAPDPMADPVFMNGFEATLAYQWRWTDGHRHQPRVAPGACGTASQVRGFWRPFQLGSLPAFAMDTRSERRPPEGDWKNAALVSDEQLQAVKDWMLAHRDEPKVLCSGSVMGWVQQRHLRTPDLCATADSWAAYPATWRTLVQFMVVQGIRHTIFLSGDYHFSGAAALTLTSGGQSVRAVSVTCSGWNATLPFTNAEPGDFVLNTDVLAPWSDEQAAYRSRAHGLGTALRQFSKLTVAPVGQGDWQLQVDVHDETGQTIGSWVSPL